MHRALVGLIVTLLACGTGATEPATPLRTAPPASPIKAIEIEAPAIIEAGFTVHLTAIVVLASNVRLRDQGVTWTTSDSSVATISETGVLDCLSPGTVTIIAAIGEVEGKAKLTVDPPQSYPW